MSSLHAPPTAGDPSSLASGVRPDLAAEPATGHLGDVVARTSGRMLADETIRAVLELVTATARQLVPHACGAGVTVADGPSGRTTTAGTDPVVEQADRRQYTLDEGPCLTAWSQRTVVRVDDLLDEPRWPRWAAAASGLGLRSALSAPLIAGDRAVGAMKVYSAVPHAFHPADEQAMSLFAAQAAVLVKAAAAYDQAGDLGDDLRAALHQRQVVDQAIGILMGRDRMSADTAFARLVALSRRDRTPVHEVAQRLVSTVSGRR
jgi:GAF domain-containing protein